MSHKIKMLSLALVIVLCVSIFAGCSAKNDLNFSVQFHNGAEVSIVLDGHSGYTLGEQNNSASFGILKDGQDGTSLMLAFFEADVFESQSGKDEVNEKMIGNRKVLEMSHVQGARAEYCLAYKVPDAPIYAAMISSSNMEEAEAAFPAFSFFSINDSAGPES